MRTAPVARLVRGPVVDFGLVGIGLFAGWLAEPDGPVRGGFAVLAAVALVLRRRAPLLTFCCTLPALLTTFALIPSLLGLYAVARRVRDRRVIAGGGLVVALGYAAPWLPGFLDWEAKEMLSGVLYALLAGGAPVFLGQLVQARCDLSERLTEITEAREHERLLIAESALAKERAQLAREMHDVVSHQVSLIAVQAGAMQVGAADPKTRAAAATLRGLSVDTLDELRHMVALLRASGGRATDLRPQPTLADLRRLVEGSGLRAELCGDMPDEDSPDDPSDGLAGGRPEQLSAPVQRAIYRTVQEALTNARKHAPGAVVTVQLRRDAGSVTVTVTNTPPEGPTLSLPSARHGLIGLRERAELLGGALSADPTTEGGFRLMLRLPVNEH